MSTVRVTDPDSATQLLVGFYPPEDKWRWVTKRFAVALRPPANASAQGAWLEAGIFIPDVEIQQLHSVTLTASVDGTVIGHETYSSAGSFKFSQPLSPALLNTNLLPVQFCFDKAMAPTEEDNRELAGIVTSVALVPASKSRGTAP